MLKVAPQTMTEWSMFQISKIATKTCPLNVKNIFLIHNRVCFDFFPILETLWYLFWSAIVWFLEKRLPPLSIWYWENFLQGGGSLYALLPFSILKTVLFIAFVSFILCSLLLFLFFLLLLCLLVTFCFCSSLLYSGDLSLSCSWLAGLHCYAFVVLCGVVLCHCS